jgi:hypothetical protein
MNSLQYHFEPTLVLLQLLPSMPSFVPKSNVFPVIASTIKDYDVENLSFSYLLLTSQPKLQCTLTTPRLNLVSSFTTPAAIAFVCKF